MTSYPVRTVTVNAFVPAAPDEVFALIADTRNDPVWCPNVDQAEQVDGDGVEVGANFRFKQHIDRKGKRVEFDATVEILDLGVNSIEWRVYDRFQIRDISIKVEPDDGGSRITQTTRASFLKKPGLGMRYGYPVVAKRTFRDQFQHLAAHFASKVS